MTNFGNKKKDSFLKRSIFASIESDTDDLSCRCKFNFSYMDFSQKAGQKFENWTHPQLYKLMNKIKDFSREPLDHWEKTKMGGGKKGKKYTVLEIYNDFPPRERTDFKHPNFIPHEVRWGRFRLGNLERLVGFVIPLKFHNIMLAKNNHYFDSNTFYVVFLDKYHKFYKPS